MALKQPPRIAGWMLNHFSSGPNKDAILGDLAEQYARKNSAIWYWRQTLKAISVTFLRKVQKRGIPALPSLILTLLTLAVITALLSDIDPFWKIGLAAILGGILVGVLMYWRGYKRGVPVEANPIGDVRIDSSKIPIRGGLGAGILIAILLTGVLVELPELRLLAAMAIVAGMVFGGVLFLWRRYHA